ncbi:hypothetical protein J6590_056895 [Homalodisca vitripennis]|nr:hypothetical protein J6590_056895 [Homalodisca vitripennis]
MEELGGPINSGEPSCTRRVTHIRCPTRLSTSAQFTHVTHSPLNLHLFLASLHGTIS